MDPDAALEELRALMYRHSSTGGATMTKAERSRFFDLVEALDGWLTKGGFLPKGWMNNR